MFAVGLAMLVNLGLPTTCEIVTAVAVPEKGASAKVLELNRVREWEATPPSELVFSWNVKGLAKLDLECRVYTERGSSAWLRIATWSPGQQTSHANPEDAVASVATDVVRAVAPIHALDLRVRLEGLGDEPAVLERLVLCAAPADPTPEPPMAVNAVAPPAWGSTIEVPLRAQGSYPRGNVLCSPTSLSMVLWHWSEVLGQPILHRDVPEVEAGVWDPEYRGAGNWSFNAAYAGSLPGMTAYVARFAGISELERWIEAGIPVICSVEYQRLQGKEPGERDSGHLVVLVGFTSEGDPVFNDPGRRTVRLVYRRADFDRAWQRSGRTVYVVHPSSVTPPNGSQGRWLE